MRDPPDIPLTPASPLQRRWPRRALAAAAVALVLFLPAGLWIAGVVVADREVEAVIRAARARGEPVLPRDFNRDPPTTGPNAVPLLREAAQVRNLSTAEQALSVAVLNGTTGPGTPAALRPLLTADAEALRLVRQARQIGRVDWSPFYPHYMTYAGETAPSAAYSANPTSLLLYDAAWLSHADGDDAAAVESLRDLLFLSRALADCPLLNSHVWSGFIGSQVAKRVEETGSELRVSAAGGDGAATAAQVRAWVADLLDESHLRRGYYKHLCYERAFWLERGEALAEANPLYRPVVRRDAARVAAVYDGVVQAVTRPNWPAARAKLGPYARGLSPPPPPILRDTPERFVRPISRSFTEMYSGPAQPRQVQAEHLFQEIAMQRMAATALALRLYQSDHGGQLPPTLAALVPQYLAQVPADPYADDGRPIGYERGGPVLYCIGLDGVDDTAGAAAIPWRPFFGRYLESDVRLFLVPPPGVRAMVPTATTAPSPKVGKQDLDVPRNPGNPRQQQGSQDEPKRGQQ